MTAGILEKIMASQQAELRSEATPHDVLSRFPERLRQREREVLASRFGIFGAAQEPKTLKEIGDALGVTRERVRQIESSGIRRLQQLATEDPVKGEVETLKLILRRLLESRGGVMEREHFLTASLSTLLEGKQDSQVHTRESRSLLFMVKHLFGDIFVPFEGTELLKPAWKLASAEHTACLETIAAAKAILAKLEKPIVLETLATAVQQQLERPAEHCEAHLCLSIELKPNAFGQWGLAHWSSVTPRRINDKIYLVLERASEPLHFAQIAQRINEAQFDEKNAHPATVHNELIFDSRYVLVGRGTYALSSWGYKPGVVSEVIVGILAAAARPLSRAAIVEQVLKQRMVRKSTVLLALTDRSKFTKLPDGRYTLAAASPSE